MEFEKRLRGWDTFASIATSFSERELYCHRWSMQDIFLRVGPAHSYRVFSKACPSTMFSEYKQDSYSFLNKHAIRQYFWSTTASALFSWADLQPWRIFLAAELFPSRSAISLFFSADLLDHSFASRYAVLQCFEQVYTRSILLRAHLNQQTCVLSCQIEKSNGVPLIGSCIIITNCSYRGITVLLQHYATIDRYRETHNIVWDA